MPELPEVETIRIGLSDFLPGKQVSSVWHDWAKGFPNSPEDVEQFLIGAVITNVKRRAKVLMIELDTNYTLVIHLKMTGQLVYVGKQESPVTSHQSPVKTDDRRQKTDNSAPEERFGAGHPNDSLIGKLPDKSTRVVFEFSDGAHLFFNDQRKFGWVRLLPSVEVPNIDFFKKVGPEPLETDFRERDFRERIKRRPKTNIKATLLDQTVIAGVGNIYADESLWAAKVHPARISRKISNRELNVIYKELRAVLQLSIDKGGSTDRNYVNAEGKKGSYLSFANVFRRNGQPCPRCGIIIIKTRVAGRGTHLCPKCQRLDKP